MKQQNIWVPCSTPGCPLKMRKKTRGPGVCKKCHLAKQKREFKIGNDIEDRFSKPFYTPPTKARNFR